MLVATLERAQRLGSGVLHHLPTEDRARIRVAALLHEDEAGDGEEEERDRDRGEKERLVVGAEHEADPDGEVGAEVSDADADSGDAAAIVGRGHLGEHRIIELEAGLVCRVGEDEREHRRPVPAARDQHGEADAEHGGDDQERHPPSGAVGHCTQQRGDDEDDPHREGGDDAVHAIGALGAHLLAHPE